MEKEKTQLYKRINDIRMYLILIFVLAACATQHVDPVTGGEIINDNLDRREILYYSEYDEGRAEVDWGADLFLIDEFEYNQQIAILAAALTAAACDSTERLGCADYIVPAYNVLGFEKDHIMLFGYPRNDLNAPIKMAEDDNYVFSIAHQTMYTEKKAFDLVAIIIRGTKTDYEKYADAKSFFPSLFTSDWHGQKSFSGFTLFAEDIREGLEYYMEQKQYLFQGEETVYLISGHSLGGAAANLFAMEMSHYYDEKIFGYTFGALNSLQSDERHTYNNIWNIFNYYDSYGPNGDFPLKPANGSITWNNRYGSVLIVPVDYRLFFDKGDDMYANHEMAGYYHAVCEGNFKNEISSNNNASVYGLQENNNTFSTEPIEDKTGYDDDTFIIEGDWVCVGEEGFGQAVPGELIMFDGQYCNLISPLDEYLFFEENGEWYLECISLENGDSGVFPVEIVDVDYIVVYNGDLTAELVWADYYYEEDYDSDEYRDVSVYGIPNGTYLSTDGFYQEFTFYGDNGIIMSAFGISAEGTYEIKDGRIIVTYEFLGHQVWKPSFSMEGESIWIAGTEFILIE